MTATLVQRHFFSITDVVSALLPDGPVDCERFEFRVNAGMLELDVVGESSQGMPSAIVIDGPVDSETYGKIAVAMADAFSKNVKASGVRSEHCDEISRVFSEAEAVSPPWDEAEPVEDAPAPLKGGPIAKKAGILCAKPLFWTFLKVRTEEAATNVLRRECGVQSRAELDHNEDAGRAFECLRGDFLVWESAH
jgi:hypothetical protein